jgi:hypothetical protein
MEVNKYWKKYISPSKEAYFGLSGIFSVLPKAAWFAQKKLT